MRCIIDNLHTRVAQASPEELTFLGTYLSFSDAHAPFRKGLKHQPIVMFNRFTESFPTGLLPLVRNAAITAGFSFAEEDTRAPALPRDPNADLSWLRDYQLTGVERAITKERGILHLSTGSGKTECAIGLALSLPGRWTFLVHRKTLLDQTASRWELRTNTLAGRIGDSQWTVEPHFTVATFQTITAALKKRDPRVVDLLRNTTGLIVDECHVLPASQAWRVAMQTPNARHRIGLSATPLARGDHKSTLAIAALGPVIYRVKAEPLIEAGAIARPIIRMSRFAHNESERPTYQGVYGECIVRNNTRNALVADLVRRADKPCLAFVKEIAHGHLLEKVIGRAGLRCDFVWGTHSSDWRAQVARALMSDRLDVAVASVVWQEGLDLPGLRSVVIASGGRSVIAALQRIGRGMRATTDKKTFEVWDVADANCGCEGVHKNCRWLDRHTTSRRRAYETEGFVVELV